MSDDDETLPDATVNPGYLALDGLGIHDKTRQAIEAMAYEGLPLPQAAERVGMRTDSLARAFDRPKVRRAFNQLVKTIRENAAQQAYLRINNIAATTQSERMAFDAGKWVAGVDGISPVQKVQGQHQHMHSFGGFVVDLSGDEYDEGEDTASPVDDAQVIVDID